MSRDPILLAAEGVNKSFSGFQAIKDLNSVADFVDVAAAKK